MGPQVCLVRVGNCHHGDFWYQVEILSQAYLKSNRKDMSVKSTLYCTPHHGSRSAIHILSEAKTIVLGDMRTQIESHFEATVLSQRYTKCYQQSGSLTLNFEPHSKPPPSIPSHFLHSPLHKQ